MVSKQILNTSLNLSVKYLNNNIDTIILNKLKKKTEGLCLENGYVLNNSIEILNRSTGTIETVNDESVINYNIKYSADVIMPVKGDKIENVYIYKKNKMGLLAYYKFKDKDIYNEKNTPINIIIPTEFLDDIENYSIGDKIEIIIKDSRLKFKSKNIQVIGSIV